MPLTSDTNVMDQEIELQDQTDELPYWPTYGKDLAHELTAPEVSQSYVYVVRRLFISSGFLGQIGMDAAGCTHPPRTFRCHTLLR